MDIPRIFNFMESAHRIHNPFTPDKFATLGAALRLESGTRVLDLGSGSGEMLCTWARDYGVIGTGFDPVTIKGVLNLSDDFLPVAYLAVGYRDPSDENAQCPKFRISESEIFTKV